jgi:hypothetical protein
VVSGEHAITISWNPVPGADSYIVYHAQGANGFEPVQWGLVATTRTQIYLQPNVTHTYYVVTVAGGAVSAPSAPASARISYPCNILTPGNPTVVGVDANGTLSFQWNAPIGLNSGAWAFQLSPQLVRLGTTARRQRSAPCTTATTGNWTRTTTPRPA